MKKIIGTLGLIFIAAILYIGLAKNNERLNHHSQSKTHTQLTETLTDQQLNETLGQKSSVESTTVSKKDKSVDVSNTKLTGTASVSEAIELENKPKTKGRKYKLINGEVVEVFDAPPELPLIESPAIENLENELVNANVEYVEFINKRMEDIENRVQNDNQNKAILELYEQEVDANWAQNAEQFVTTFFSTQPSPTIKLYRVHCRQSSCEVFGRYFPYEDTIELTTANRQVFQTAGDMEKLANYKLYFNKLEFPSIHMPDDNSYMSFYYFLTRAD